MAEILWFVNIYDNGFIFMVIPNLYECEKNLGNYQCQPSVWPKDLVDSDRSVPQKVPHFFNIFGPPPFENLPTELAGVAAVFLFLTAAYYLMTAKVPRKKNAATHQRYVGWWVGWSLCSMEWRWNDSFFVFVFPQPLTKLGRNCRGYLVDSYIFSDGQLWWFILQLIFTRPRATNRGRLLRIRPANPTSRDFRGVFLLDTWVQNPSKNAGDASAANLFQSEKRKLFQTKRHHGQRIAWKLDNII